MHVKNRGIWEVKYDRGSFYIHSLEDMMQFYGLKPYHMIVVYYVDVGVFNLMFCTPYTVEMNYLIDEVGFIFDIV